MYCWMLGDQTCHFFRSPWLFSRGMERELAHPTRQRRQTCTGQPKSVTAKRSSGLHYQIGSAAQAKLVWVTAGRVFDVVVDLRQSSKSFGKWFGHYLDAASCERIWIPEGCAHGFLVVSEQADFQYKVTKPYSPKHERSLSWKDASLSIDWPLAAGHIPILSTKDASAPTFPSCDKFS
jgi:dTDP-4-dehydrorhamnose 3,5-epimerase